jgi:hypothetical protein
MKAITGFILAIILFIGIYGMIMSNYKYDRDIQSNWKLADKASTMKQKAIYIDKYVSALESSNLSGSYNALILTTPDNSFDMNLEQLKTLQTRLHSVDTMNIQSFAYQTAIQQITAQEQGEAKCMLDVFEGCWNKIHYWYLWNWIGVTIYVLSTIGLIIFILWLIDWDNL